MDSTRQVKHCSIAFFLLHAYKFYIFSYFPDDISSILSLPPITPARTSLTSTSSPASTSVINQSSSSSLIASTKSQCMPPPSSLSSSSSPSYNSPRSSRRRKCHIDNLQVESYKTEIEANRALCKKHILEMEVLKLKKELLLKQLAKFNEA